MGEEVKIKDVQVENDATLLQVDFEVGGKGDRMFIQMRDVYKALNNYAYLKNDKTLLEMGGELIDSENYKNPNLID